MGIRRYSMYDPEDSAIDGLLYDMATEPFSQIGKTEISKFSMYLIF